MTSIQKENFRKISKKILKTNLTTNVDTLSKYLSEILAGLQTFVNFVKNEHENLDASDITLRDSLLEDIKYVRALFTRSINKLGYAYDFKKSAWDIPTIDLLTAFEGTIPSDPDSDSNSNSKTNDMATANDVKKDIGKTVPDFDGNPDCLLRFLDALELAKLSVGAHEKIAVLTIKTKLIGKARNCLSNTETTIDQIIASVKAGVKSESTDVITGKIMNLRQLNKSAQVYVEELTKLTDALKGAYISEGFTSTIADKYATKQAVKAMTQNANNGKVKLVMEAGQFSDLNEATSKFLESNNNTANSASVLYMGNGFRGRFRGRFRNNYNPRSNQTDRYHDGNRNNSNRYNNRNNGQFNNNNGRFHRNGYNNNNNRNGNNRPNNGNSGYSGYNNNRAVRVIDEGQGNSPGPGQIRLGRQSIWNIRAKSVLQ